MCLWINSLFMSFFLNYSYFFFHSQSLLNGNEIMMPQFDFQQKKRLGYKVVNAPKSGVVRMRCSF